MARSFRCRLWEEARRATHMDVGRFARRQEADSQSVGPKGGSESKGVAPSGFAFLLVSFLWRRKEKSLACGARTAINAVASNHPRSGFPKNNRPQTSRPTHHPYERNLFI